MTISVVTTTANRAVGMHLAEVMMTRQTRQPDQWIVADGGIHPAVLTLDQVHLFRSTDMGGPRNFLDNLLRALPYVTGDAVVMWEDDDWYAPTHLARLVEHLETSDDWLVGDATQRYYNVRTRQYRQFVSQWPSLCQMAFRAEAIPAFRQAVRAVQPEARYEVDCYAWTYTHPDHRRFHHDGTVVGIKGVPGQTGLGAGHRPDQTWHDDGALHTLTRWIGDDHAWYRDFWERGLNGG
jgi:hypothetical protein